MRRSPAGRSAFVRAAVVGVQREPESVLPCEQGAGLVSRQVTGREPHLHRTCTSAVNAVHRASVSLFVSFLVVFILARHGRKLSQEGGNNHNNYNH